MTKRKQGLAAALGVAALAAGAPAAPAATISLEDLGDGIVAWTYAADDGRHDVVTMYQGPDRDGIPRITFGLIDGPAQPLSFPTEHCFKDAMDGVNCDARVANSVALLLKDGNDKVAGNTGDDRMLQVPMFALGGPGDDTLAGGASGDLLDGAEGDDALTDTPQQDVLAAGPGNDTLTSNGPNFPGDSFDGGDGTDHLHVGRGATHMWTLDGQANDGVDGEGDNAQAIEGLTAEGTADVVLIGDDGPNRLDSGSATTRTILRGLGGDDALRGGQGTDKLEGGDGNDRLQGEEGDDELDGGGGVDAFTGDRKDSYYGYSAGNDRILARDGNAEAIDCGLGADTAQVDATDVVPGDGPSSCEAVDRDGGGGPTGGGAGGSPAGGGGGGGATVVVAPKALGPRIVLGGRARDRRAPYRFALTGRVADKGGCARRTVTLEVRKGRRLVLTRKVRLSALCTFRTSVRLRRKGRYTAVVRGVGLRTTKRLRAG